MATPKNTILNWFLTGLYPTQAQFHAAWNSFWHKDESIPQSSIENLQQSLDDKLDVEAYVQNEARPVTMVNGHPFTLIKHPDNNDPEMASTRQINDVVTDGFWDGTEYWYFAQQIANDGSQKSDWDIKSRQKGLTTV